MQGDASSIVAAIRKLGSEDSSERVLARETLEKIGRPATWHLIQAAYPPGERTRHEALKALVSLADPAATEFFLEHLEDENSDCRWLAGQGLAALGPEALRRTLGLLAEFPRTDHLLRAVHHVLSEFRTTGFEQVVTPVLGALGSTVPEVEVPIAAHNALNELRKARHPRPDAPTSR